MLSDDEVEGQIPPLMSCVCGYLGKASEVVRLYLRTGLPTDTIWRVTLYRKTIAPCIALADVYTLISDARSIFRHICAQMRRQYIICQHDYDRLAHCFSTMHASVIGWPFLSYEEETHSQCHP